MFKIKKNGVIKNPFGGAFSLLASAIGFTPPTGMSATDVQGAIEEVATRVTANTLDSVSIDLSAQTFPYTIPSDGYITFIVVVSGESACTVAPGITLADQRTSGRTPVYVKKGTIVTTVYVSGDGTCDFRAIG